MTEQATRLEGREEIAAGTVAFHLAKPEGFRFKAGQAIDLVLPDPHSVDNPGLRHTFSLVSAPFQDELVVATRMRNTPFKEALGRLQTGAPVLIDGPFGALTLESAPVRPVVLIAGGIGITPFVSMLRQIAHERSPHAMTLLYSNRRPEDAAFLDELRALERRIESLRLLPTMTAAAASSLPWPGRRGPIDGDWLRQITAELRDPLFYVVGSPAMVETMHGILTTLDIRSDDIHGEDFYGY